MLGSAVKIANFYIISLNSTAACMRRRFIYNTILWPTSPNRGYVEPSSNNCSKLLNTNKEVSHRELFFRYSTTVHNPTSFGQELSATEYDKISNETLESLTDFFDEIVEQAAHLEDADVSYGDGVLTVKFGEPYGTYVLNRQTPNKQIWLSSPKSGPKRYDFIGNKWIYKHDGISLHQLLNSEIPEIVKSPISFDNCVYSGEDN